MTRYRGTIKGDKIEIFEDHSDGVGCIFLAFIIAPILFFIFAKNEPYLFLIPLPGVIIPFIIAMIWRDSFYRASFGETFAVLFATGVAVSMIILIIDAPSPKNWWEIIVLGALCTPILTVPSAAILSVIIQLRKKW